MQPRGKRPHYRNGRSSVSGRILRHIQRHGRIAPADAWIDYGVRDLDRVACSLAADGHPIERYSIKTDSGAGVSIWRLRR